MMELAPSRHCMNLLITWILTPGNQQVDELSSERELNTELNKGYTGNLNNYWVVKGGTQVYLVLSSLSRMGPRGLL